jgi:hypothetical protein
VRSEFTFDLLARRLTWTRRGPFSRTGGVVPFEQIRYAFTERSYADGDADTFCVTLRTDAGALSLSPFYTSGQGRFDSIRDTINTALGRRFGDLELMESHILELARAGKKRLAIQYAQKRYGYDLTQAKAYVAGLTK